MCYQCNKYTGLDQTVEVQSAVFTKDLELSKACKVKRDFS